MHTNKLLGAFDSMAAKKHHSYISVKWVHSNSEYPILLVSELSETRMETRKLEYFKSGDVGIASRKRSSNGTVLGTEPVPTSEEINRDKEFICSEISRAEFESQWEVYV
jgi:hypothetical protein